MKPTAPKFRLSERLRAVKHRRKGVEFSEDVESPCSARLTNKPKPADNRSQQSTDAKK
jgi:hypothetical protein